MKGAGHPAASWFPSRPRRFPMSVDMAVSQGVLGDDQEGFERRRHCHNKVSDNENMFGLGMRLVSCARTKATGGQTKRQPRHSTGGAHILLLLSGALLGVGSVEPRMYIAGLARTDHCRRTGMSKCGKGTRCVLPLQQYKRSCTCCIVENEEIALDYVIVTARKSAVLKSPEPLIDACQCQ